MQGYGLEVSSINLGFWKKKPELMDEIGNPSINLGFWKKKPELMDEIGNPSINLGFGKKLK
jgi:hypothetical protein